MIFLIISQIEELHKSLKWNIKLHIVTYFFEKEGVQKSEKPTCSVCIDHVLRFFV